MNNEIAIILLRYMQKAIRIRLEHLIEEIDENYNEAIKKLEGMK